MKKTLLSIILSTAILFSVANGFAAKRVDSPNMALTTTEPLAENDNLVQKGVDIPDIFFGDIQNHWAEPTIKMLATDGYLHGESTDAFCPDDLVTRAEFIKMAVNGLKLAEVEYDGCATDVSNEDWFAATISTANQNGLLDDALFVDNQILPNMPITREDAALIISFAAEKSGAVKADENIEFSDFDDASVYAKDGIKNATAFKMINGYPDGTFMPKSTLVRAEAAEMLSRLIEINSRLAIYVDKDGNDENDGTKTHPVASIEKALELARTLNKDMKNNLFIFLKSDEYFVSSTINLGVEESGTNGYNIILSSYGEKRAELTTGKDFSGFELFDADKNIYRTKVGDINTRQVYINGVRAIRARSVEGLTNGKLEKDFGYTSDDTFLADFKNIKDLEMVCFRFWIQGRCLVDNITVEDSRAKIVMNEKVWKEGTESNASWQLPFWYENAFELLDIPGEWYINKTDGYLYYIPREFENPASMIATIPTSDRIMTISGTVDAPAHNIAVQDIEFNYTTWLGATSAYPLQNNSFDNKIAEPAVYVTCARYINFRNNKFDKLGASGLHMMYSVQDSNVIGNEFADISGGAFSMGHGRGETYEQETKPTEYKYYTINNKFNNNYVHDVGVEYSSAAAVSASYPKMTQFNHNEITNSTYCGMHIGFGWEVNAEDKEKKGTGLYKVQVNNNYVHDVLTTYTHDGGCIYLMGVTGGTYDNPSECSNNYLQNSRNGYGTLYFDSGATYWLSENNVIDETDVDEWTLDGILAPLKPRWALLNGPSTRYNILQNNYATTNENLIDRTYNSVDEPILFTKENGKLPTEVQKIVDNAGIENSYLSRFNADAQRLDVNLTALDLKIGDTININPTVYGRYEDIASANSYKLFYTSSDSDIASVDENGKVTVVNAGHVKIYANLLADEIVRSKEIDIICGDELESVSPDGLTLVAGYTSKIEPVGKSKFGKTVEFNSENATFSSNDTSIATVDKDGNAHGVTVGETTIHAVYTAKNTTLEKDIPVKVLDYSSKDALTIKTTPLPPGVFNPSKWVSVTAPGTEFAKLTDDKNGIAVTGNASYYGEEKLKSGLYEFDMQIDNPHSWPSIALKVPDKTKKYSQSDCYFIGFNEGYIELQRFNEGKRTAFLSIASLEPITGPGVPNFGQVLEYGKKYHISVGATGEENGVRLILNIDGKNIFDYLDNFDGYLKGDGYFGVYVGSGTFTFFK